MLQGVELIFMIKKNMNNHVVDLTIEILIACLLVCRQCERKKQLKIYQNLSDKLKTIEKKFFFFCYTDLLCRVERPFYLCCQSPRTRHSCATRDVRFHHCYFMVLIHRVLQAL